MPRTIRTEIQKRFSDIDSFRHVNNVSQQMYFDVGKSDFFDRLLGPEILFAPVRIITAATDTSYMGQIRPEDRIAVTTCVERIGTKSLTLLQRIVADDGTVRSQSRSVMVAFDFEALANAPTIARSHPGSRAWPPAMVEIYRSFAKRLPLPCLYSTATSMAMRLASTPFAARRGVGSTDLVTSDCTSMGRLR